MQKKRQALKGVAKKSEIEVKKKLERPPKDPREVTIGPTMEAGPDVTIS